MRGTRLAMVGYRPSSCRRRRRELGVVTHAVPPLERSDRPDLVEHAVVVADERGIRHGAEVLVGGCSGPSGQYEEPPPSTSFIHQIEVACTISQRSNRPDHSIARSIHIGVFVRRVPGTGDCRCGRGRRRRSRPSGSRRHSSARPPRRRRTLRSLDLAARDRRKRSEPSTAKSSCTQSFWNHMGRVAVRSAPGLNHPPSGRVRRLRLQEPTTASESSITSCISIGGFEYLDPIVPPMRFARA